MKKKINEKANFFRWVIALIFGVAVLALPVLLLRPPAPEPIPGIDVSAHQGVIDWPAVAESGVKYAVIRLGYRSYRDGRLYIDEQAIYNLTEARAAGLKIGAYFFSQALNEEEARQEAAFAMEILDGMELDLPLAYDWEHVAGSTRTAAMDRDTLTACVHAFCGSLEGYEPMVYFNLDLSRTLLNIDALSEYDFWFAQYADAPQLSKPIRFWQYSDQGTVPGICEKVDLNWLFQP